MNILLAHKDTGKIIEVSTGINITLIITHFLGLIFAYIILPGFISPFRLHGTIDTIPIFVIFIISTAPLLFNGQIFELLILLLIFGGYYINLCFFENSIFEIVSSLAYLFTLLYLIFMSNENRIKSLLKSNYNFADQDEKNINHVKQFIGIKDELSTDKEASPSMRESNNVNYNLVYCAKCGFPNPPEHSSCENCNGLI